MSKRLPFPSSQSRPGKVCSTKPASKPASPRLKPVLHLKDGRFRLVAGAKLADDASSGTTGAKEGSSAIQ